MITLPRRVTRFPPTGSVALRTASDNPGFPVAPSPVWPVAEVTQGCGHEHREEFPPHLESCAQFPKGETALVSSTFDVLASPVP